MVQVKEAPTRPDQVPPIRDLLLVNATTELRNRLETFLPDGQQETTRFSDVRNEKYRIRRTPDGFEIEEIDLHPSKAYKQAWQISDTVTVNLRHRNNTYDPKIGENGPKIPPTDLNLTAIKLFEIMLASTEAIKP